MNNTNYPVWPGFDNAELYVKYIDKDGCIIQRDYDTILKQYPKKGRNK